MTANEPYQTIGHREAANLIADELSRLGWHAKREFVLPDGKVADVLFRTDDADFAVVEVKTEIKASLLDSAWRKYAKWSNLLWLAVPELRLPQLQGLEVQRDWTSQRDKIGILGIYREGIVAYRSPAQRTMHPDLYGQLATILHLA